MKKLLCILVALLALCCLLVACDGGDDPDEGAAPAPEHTHAYGSWVVSTLASCSTKGVETRTCSCGAVETRDVAMTPHIFGDWAVSKAATCTVAGEERRSCDSCGSVETKVIPASGTHDYGEWTTVEAMTCTSNGQEKRSCACGAFETRTVLATHSFTNGVCGMCERVAYTRTGDTVYFGTYPQTQVTTTTVINDLNSSAGALPTSTDSGRWTSYGFYEYGGEVGNFMWYIDIWRGGEQFRGVYFTDYRDDYLSFQASGIDYNQEANGYATETVYWFRYDPIAWTVIAESNGVATLLCDMIIDANEYYQSTISRTEGESSISPNHYAESAIRAWLNEAFLETAFTSLHQQILLTTTVDNSSATTPNGTPFWSENTEDKVFLLSARDSYNEGYGFEASGTQYDAARQKQTTAYAKAMGAYTVTDPESDYLGNGWWWLRSPHENQGQKASCVTAQGYARGSNDVNYTGGGIVPAVRIQL